MEVRRIKEPDNEETLRQCLALLGFFVVFALLCIPIYLLMTAGAKNSTEISNEEISSEASYEVKRGGTALLAGRDKALDGKNYDTGKRFTSGDDFDDEFNDTVPDSDLIEKNEQNVPQPDFSPEEMMSMQYKLNGFAFFGGFALIIIFYTLLFELILKNRFYPLMQGGKGALSYSLLCLGIGIFLQILEITLIPMRVTKGIAALVGIPWEIAYIIPAYMMILTLVGTWLDTNHNKMVLVDGEIFRYVQFGKGPMPLIIIPGLSLRTLKGSGNMLAIMYHIFAENHTVYVMDKRDEVPEDVTLEELSEDISAVMDCIGIKRANVVGISMGGMIAQYLAINHPDKVNKLVLGVTASRMNDTIRDFINHNIALAKKGEMDKIQAEMFKKMYTREYFRKYKPFIPLLSKMGIPKSNTRFIRLSQSILTLDIDERIHDIICPVLVLGGGEDKIVGRTAADDLVRDLQCERYVYRKLGHAAYEEAKDFNERIARFLAK